MAMHGDDEETAADNSDNGSTTIDTSDNSPSDTSSSTDFSVDSGNSPSTVSGIPPTMDAGTTPDIQLSPDQPDYVREADEQALSQPVPTHDQPVIRARTLDDEPPLRSGEEEAPDNPHLPHEEEEEKEEAP